MSQLQTIQWIRELLEASSATDASLLFPSLLIFLPQVEVDETRKPGTTMADLAIRYFLELGLFCDRTRQNLYGYPGLFRELTAPPPWIEVTIEDTEDLVSLEREGELRPLYIQANQTDAHILLQKYREHLDFRSTTLARVGLGGLAPPAMNNLSVELFREQLELARCLVIEQFETLFECVLNPCDEFVVAPGAPDLFVWSESHQLWFFAEVKGPHDSLRGSQSAWIRGNWAKIKGRFALVLVHGV